MQKVNRLANSNYQTVLVRKVLFDYNRLLLPISMSELTTSSDV